VIERIGVRSWSVHFLKKDLEFARHSLDLLPAAGQADEARIEGRDVAPQQLRRVAFGIERHEQDLDPVGVRSQQPAGLRQLRQRRRADIRTVRIAEEQYDDLAAVVSQAAPRAAGIGEREVARVVGAAYVDIIEVGLRAARKDEAY